jgi:hypothetical protein
LEAASANCGRYIPPSEITDAVTNSKRCAWDPTRRISSSDNAAKKWPELNKERREAILAKGPKLADFWESSPVRVVWDGSRTEEIIDQIFPGSNHLLCVGQSSKRFVTKAREDLRGQCACQQFIVPSPMTAPVGRKKNPKPGETEWSAHTLDNTAARRFLITEFDSGTADEHAALLSHLARFAPLVLAVHSGNKSLHGWFFCAGLPEEEVNVFMRYAVSLGADHALWTRCQFTRMPDGTRDNGQRQTIYFFNPKPIK